MEVKIDLELDRFRDIFKILLEPFSRNENNILPPMIFIIISSSIDDTFTHSVSVSVTF